MSKNMSSPDRWLRALAVAPSLAVVAALLGFGSIGGIVFVFAAAVMLVTATVGLCPLYTLFHITTRRPPLAQSH